MQKVVWPYISPFVPSHHQIKSISFCLILSQTSNNWKLNTVRTLYSGDCISGLCLFSHLFALNIQLFLAIAISSFTLLKTSLKLNYFTLVILFKHIELVSYVAVPCSWNRFNIVLQHDETLCCSSGRSQQNCSNLCQHDESDGYLFSDMAGLVLRRGKLLSIPMIKFQADMTGNLHVRFIKYCRIFPKKYFKVP